MRVWRPSVSLIDDKIADNASFAASASSASGSLSIVLTRAFKITVNLLLSALPATVTNAANARALNTVIGRAVNVGMRTGKTVEART